MVKRDTATRTKECVTADDRMGLMLENRVRELREDRLMTQSELAGKAKLALRTVLSIEKGMECRMDTKRKLIRAFGISLADKDLVFPTGRRQDIATRTRKNRR